MTTDEAWVVARVISRATNCWDLTTRLAETLPEVEWRVLVERATAQREAHIDAHEDWIETLDPLLV